MEEKQKEERKERKKEKEKKRREKEGKEGRPTVLPLISGVFDGRSPPAQELKSIYSMRAMLQDVGILPTWVYFHPKKLFCWIFVDDEAALF